MINKLSVIFVWRYSQIKTDLINSAKMKTIQFVKFVMINISKWVINAQSVDSRLNKWLDKKYYKKYKNILS